MNMGRKRLGLIPARGGSKRLVRKNCLEFNGKPLIAWTIEAALKSGCFERCIVSTDDEEIAAHAEKYGADVPFLRPKSLSSDTAKSVDVASHTIEFMKDEYKETYEYMTLLQPTSPLRDSRHIAQAFDLLREKDANGVISVTTVEYPQQWLHTLPEDKNMSDFVRKIDTSTRSQDFPALYRLNGAIYICNVKRFLEEQTFFLKSKCFAYVMPVENSVDIDNRYDFELAAWMMRNPKRTEG